MTPDAMQEMAVVFRASKATRDERALLIEAAQDSDVQTTADFTGRDADTYRELCRRAGMPTRTATAAT